MNLLKKNRTNKLSKTLYLVIILLLPTFLNAESENLKKAKSITLTPHGHLGWSVSLKNNVGLISAPHEDTKFGKNAGAVYVYSSNNEYKERLLPSSGQPFENFGYSISHDGTTAIIGAVGNTNNGPFSGCAYIFRNNGSNFEYKQQITAADGNPMDMFGCSVSINNDLAVIGAQQAKGNNYKSGAAYIYRFDGSSWILEAKLSASDGLENDHFGHSVTLSEDGVVVIGAYSSDGNASKSGSVYIFEKNSSKWEQAAKLTASDGKPRDLFGYSVSINKNLVLVGAYQNVISKVNHGAAYLYSKTNDEWKQVTKLTPDNGKTHDYFGISVALDDSIALVGASRTDVDDLVDVGSVYVFKKQNDEWSKFNILKPEDGKSNDHFGLSVEFDKELTLVGSRLSDNDGEDAGSAYLINNSTITGAEQEEIIPTKFELLQNYPNPFNPKTSINFSVINKDVYTLKIYNALGQNVTTLLDATLTKGNYSIQFNAKHYSSGIYFYKLSGANKTFTKKMLLVK